MLALRAEAVLGDLQREVFLDLVAVPDRADREPDLSLARERAALDGIYVLRSGGVSADQLQAAAIVRAYKQLKENEKAFGTIKGPLEVRPIHHHLEDRVRAHLLICMLAHYLVWHLRTAWTELLYQDPYPASNVDPVAKATRSSAAKRKAHTHRTPDRQPCQTLKSVGLRLSSR